MGHSFYTSTSPPPKLVRSILTEHSAAPAAVARTKRTSYTPRSSGFGNGEDTPAKREYAATKDDLSALQDFLRRHNGGESAPAATAMTTKTAGAVVEDAGRGGRKDPTTTRRKRGWGVFSRSSGGPKKGRRQVEEAGGGSGSGSGSGLRNVAVRESRGGKMFKGGKKYLEIVVDEHEMHEWDKSAATKLEKGPEEAEAGRVERGKGVGGDSHANGKMGEELFVLPTLDSGRDADGYEIGLTKQIPHLDVGSRKSSPQRDAGIKTKDSRAAKMKVKPRPRRELEQNTHDFAFDLPTLSSGVATVSYAKPQAPLVVASDYAPAQMPPRGLPLEINNKIGESANPTTTSKSQVPAPAPSGTQAWPIKTATPQTPQHSAQNSAEIKISPVTDRQSKAPSMLSTHDSIASDVQSDAESAIIMNAQSAEFVRARKPPKPGPAPTRALPSLPEVHDGFSYATRLPNDSSQNRISIDSVSGYSPKKMQPSSPTRKYRYSPIKSPVPKSMTLPPKIGFTLPPERALLQSPDLAQMTRSATLVPCNDASADNLSPIASERKQVRKVRSTKAMKTRDMERLRSHHQDSLDLKESRSTGSKNKEDSDGTVFLPDVSNGYDGRSSLATTDKKGLGISEAGSGIGHDHAKIRSSYELSPIIVVAEEEPTIATNSNQRLSGRSYSGKKRSTAKRTDLNGSSEVENLKENASRLSSYPAGKANYAHGKNEAGQKVNGQANGQTESSEQVNSQPSSATEIEARLEARISAIEKKNGLLQRLFLAVLDTSPPLGPSHSDRSSGLSATSSLFAMEAKVDALLTLVQENKRLSAEL